jgi:prepilin signal peptidase PulO-like enzyme (type II secretory pathway)
MTGLSTAGLITTAVTATLTWLLIVRAQPRWAQRDITVTRTTATIAAATAIIIGVLASTNNHAATVTAAAATLAALSALAVYTDLRDRKIPKEATYVAAGAGAFIMLAAYGAGDAPTYTAIMTAVAWLVLTGVPFLMWMATGRGLGMGDVRYISAATILTAWWAGPTAPLVAVLIAIALQLILRLIVVVTAKSAARPFTREPVTTLTATDETATATRLELPFAPSLAAAFLGITIGLVLNPTLCDASNYPLC